MKSLDSLRSLRWDRDDHKAQLEELLMMVHDPKRRPMVLTRARALIVGLALLFFGGLAGAVGTAGYIYRWGGQKIEIQKYDDGRERVIIHDEKTGEKTLDTVLEPGTQLFQVVDDDGKKANMKVKESDGAKKKR